MRRLVDDPLSKITNQAYSLSVSNTDLYITIAHFNHLFVSMRLAEPPDMKRVLCSPSTLFIFPTVILPEMSALGQRAVYDIHNHHSSHQVRIPCTVPTQ